MKFYLIIPAYSKEIGYKKFTFGPYKNHREALRASKTLGSGIIVRLNTGNLEEAVKILDRSRR